VAFNKAPTQSTYQTKDVKLLMALDNRDQAGTKDVIALNGFYDLIKDKTTNDNSYMFVKRDGTVEYPYEIPTANIRGMHYWEDQDKLYVAYNDRIAIITASTGVLVTTVVTFVSTTGEVGFTEFYYDTGSVKLVACDGLVLITIDSSNVVVTGSDPDMPTPMRPHPVFIDGYLFLIKSGTSDIYNSDLNDPLAYTSGDFITAEMLPDTLIRISRLNNYLVAFGSASIEYFYDAANASGSPLNRNDTPIKQIGYLGGLAAHANKLFFVGQTSHTEPEVFMIEDFKMESLDNPSLRRFIQPYSTFSGCVISQGGHDFYILTVGTITYCMDLETGVWTRMALKGGTTFPAKYSVNLPFTGVGNVSVMAVEDNTSLFYFDPDVYQDDGVNYTVTVQTDKQMFDTMHEKTMARVLVVADRPTTSADLLVSITDDDYQTYSTPRAVDLNQEFPSLYRWGRFRKRAFKLDFTENAPLRMQHLEVDFNIGR
jgi:hypothetical protein